MRLLLDVGNTRCKWALADDRALVRTGVIVRDTAHAWLNALPDVEVEEVMVASVAQPEALGALAAWAAPRGVPLRQATTTARFGGLTNGYTVPERLGVDRWLACIAARVEAPGSVLIADAGTALTIDFIDAEGRHQGGLIAPGVKTMRESLRERTQLRPAPDRIDDPWLARDTNAAIAAGTRNSAVSLLEAGAAHLAPERLLLTGGDAPLLVERLRAKWHLRPHLVLEGLAHLAAAPG